MFEILKNNGYVCDTNCITVYRKNITKNKKITVLCRPDRVMFEVYIDNLLRYTKSYDKYKERDWNDIIKKEEKKVKNKTV